MKPIQEIKRKIELLEQAIKLSKDAYQKAMWRIMIQDLEWNLENEN